VLRFDKIISKDKRTGVIYILHFFGDGLKVAWRRARKTQHLQKKTNLRHLKYSLMFARGTINVVPRYHFIKTEISDLSRHEKLVM
jgi:hypothetical protein